MMTQTEGAMKVRNLRLALGLFFAAMAALLFLRNEIAPEASNRRAKSTMRSTLASACSPVGQNARPA